MEGGNRQGHANGQVLGIVLWASCISIVLGERVEHVDGIVLGLICRS